MMMKHLEKIKTYTHQPPYNMVDYNMVDYNSTLNVGTMKQKASEVVETVSRRRVDL